MDDLELDTDRSQKTRSYENELPYVRGAVAVNRTTCWVMLVFLATRLAAAETSPAKPTVITLPAGVTSAEIQSALDALPVSGGEVVLPAGRFEIHQPVVLQRDGQSLRGAGADTILHLADNVNCPVIILGEPVNAPIANHPAPDGGRIFY